MAKSDIEIAQEAKMLPITEVAKRVGLKPEQLELYGNYKGRHPRLHGRAHEGQAHSRYRNQPHACR